MSLANECDLFCFEVAGQLFGADPADISRVTLVDLQKPCALVRATAQPFSVILESK